MINLSHWVLFLFSLVLMSESLSAQEIPIGQWRSHLPYEQVIAITESEDRIYAATKISVFYIEKEDESIGLLNKVNGLSDAGIRNIKFNKNNNTLLVAYSSGNVDLVRENGIENISFIATSSSISGDREIRHINMVGSDAYLSCSFGIIKLDMDKPEFSFTTFTSFPCNASVVYNDQIFLSTEEGIYKIPLSEPNPTFIGSWELLNSTSTAGVFPSIYESASIQIFGDNIYAAVNDTLFVSDGTGWSHLENTTPDGVVNPMFVTNRSFEDLNLSWDEEELLISSGFNFFSRLKKDHSVETFTLWSLGQIRQTIKDKSGEIWMADGFFGLHKKTEFSAEKVIVNGPPSSSTFDMTSINGDIWGVSGGTIGYFDFTFNSKGAFRFRNGEWTTFKPADNPQIAGTKDYIVAVGNPKTNKVYFGTFGWGVVEYDQETFKVYDNNTPGCSLQTPIADNTKCRIAGLGIDSKDNLWVSNNLAPNPISVLKTDGTWRSYSNSLGVSAVAEMTIDRNDYKWIRLPSKDILVFDSGDPNDPAAQPRYYKITSGNSNLPAERATCLVADKDGHVWVGTPQGIVIFRCTNQIFDGECPGYLPILQEEGFGGYLLATEVINSIAVDGANRKWVATNNGVFLLSEDGENLIYYFTEFNSPLFANGVNRVAINGETGEVYFSTSKGLISFRSTAIEGKAFNDPNAYVYPNPVRPEYTGQIAVKGLVENANVKITDVSGTLMFETQAFGGQAVWDGHDYNGRRAASGVYLVFVTNSKGDQNMVTKFVIVN